MRLSFSKAVKQERATVNGQKMPWAYEYAEYVPPIPSMSSKDEAHVPYLDTLHVACSCLLLLVRATVC